MPAQTTDCNPVELSPTALDPNKRVRYTLGLVLGVDEFQQEQHYFLERGRLHNRSLHGYGTVTGLGVTVRHREAGPEVVVAPGLAVDANGQTICVRQTQCARLEDWLGAHEAALQEALDASAGSFPEALPVYVVLCYRECGTDSVPVPGAPCRSPDDTMTASRIAESFRLELRLTPPPQVEEDAVRRFGALLNSIEVTDEDGTLTAAELQAWVRTLAPEGTFPPESLPSLPPPDASLPEEEPSEDGPVESYPDSLPEGLTIGADVAAEAVQAAFRTWAVEVRPHLQAAGGGAPCGAAPKGDGCVLLAELRVDLVETAGGLGIGGPVTVDERDRPVLLSTRLLQERFALGRGAREEVSSVHADLTGLDADDHPQYLLADGSRPLTGRLDAGANRISRLAASRAAADAVRRDEVVRRAEDATADLEGPGSTFGAPRVTGLHGHPVAVPDEGRNDGHVLTFARRRADQPARWVLRPLEADEAPADRFVQAPDGPYAIVAAGHFDSLGNEHHSPTYGKLTATPVENDRTGLYRLHFSSYQQPQREGHTYIVKGTVEDRRELPANAVRATFQFVGFLGDENRDGEDDGLLVRVMNIRGQPLQEVELGFMVEISQIGRLPR